MQSVRSCCNMAARINAVKVVSLDAKDTLISLVEPPSLTYSRFAATRGLHLDKSRIGPSFIKAYERLTLQRPYFGFQAGGPKQWWSELIGNVIEETQLEEASSLECTQLGSELYDFYSTRDAWQLIDPNTDQTLQRLKEAGFRLAIISNFDSRLHGLLQQFGLTPHFDCVALSGELGSEKPAPELFLHVLKQCDLQSPSQLLHVGNDLEKDLEGATSFHANGLLFDPENQQPLISKDRKIRRLSDLCNLLA